MTATRCRRVRTARSRRVGSRKRTQAVRRQAAQRAVEIRSIRGVDTLRVHQNKLCAIKPMVEALSFPLFRPFKALKSPPAGPRVRTRRETRGTRVELSVHGRVRTVSRGCSSVGRAPALHAGGHRFESGHLHQHFVNRIGQEVREILVERSLSPVMGWGESGSSFMERESAAV
jgi:hypothetical protein